MSSTGFHSLKMSGMEAALASGLLKMVGNKLFAMISSEFSSLMHVKKDLSELRVILETVASRLSALQDREIENDPSFRWVQKLKVFCYDIEDLLDEVKLEVEKQNRDSDGENHAVADCFCAKPKSFVFRCKVAHKIKAIKASLNEIVKQTSNINTILQNLPVDPPVSSRSNAAELYLLANNVEEIKIPKRDQEQDKIISKLVESNEGANVLMICVVGIGGSGKTTLAKHICHDEKIRKHFKDIFKVHVSREFDLDRLIGKLFEEITKEKSDLHPRSYMVNKISNKLGKDKFLLVLDDAWHKNRHDWEQFLLHVKSGTPGSRVLLTTRDEGVADAVESWYTHKLKFLSEPESWGFFLKISGWTEDEGSEIIKTGKEIVKKCGGVPLAIKILGGVLRGKSEIDTLRAIRRSSLWKDESIEDQVFACLKMSYIHLENHLKQCFIFCAIFPKGYKINKDRLIAQWIAHGFVNPRNEERPEDIGSEYFDSLVKVGFLQDAFESWNEDGLKYKMHDLIYDLTQKMSEHDVMTSLLKTVPTDHTHKFRYLSLMATSCSQKIDRGLFDKVRALYVCDGNQSFHESLTKSRYIQSVILHYASHMPFPMFILNFEHLGYLEISNFSCVKLPEAISNCWNLQALYFINCNGFVTLPKSVGKLKKLRILDLMRITDLESLPQSIGDCRDLQCLRICFCHKLREIADSIGKIENLRVLHIVNCENVQRLSFGSIGEFRDIETINLSGCTSLRDLPSAFASRTLRTLDLSRTKIITLPQWVTLIDSLECINLKYCKELVELPTDIGNLEGLKVLCIGGCNKLRCMPPGIGQLTRLTSLGLFVVGCSGDDARISELEHLDMISGDMEIRNIKYLKDPTDAEKACLKGKNRIQSLTLQWSKNGTEEELVWDMDQDLGVMSALEPPSEVNSLVISSYGGPCLPHWMEKETEYSYWVGKVLKQTSPCPFPYLTNLILTDFPNIKHLRGLVELPSLKSFLLDRMPNLEELYTTKSGLEIEEEQLGGQYCFPALSNLRISGCPKLKVKPYFPPSLEELMLQESNEQLLSPSNFFHLFSSPLHESKSLHSSDLTLGGMTGSSSGWEFLQHITGLEYLELYNYDDLTQLPESIRCLTSLRKLWIEKCPALGSLPEWLEELRYLKNLDVRHTPMLTCLPQSVEHLTSLERLSIFGWSNMMTQLPEVIQHLTSLSVIQLGSCGGLTTLPEWMGQLSALKRLYIFDCSALHSLPSSMHRLTALQKLYIRGCPALTERYKKDVGVDWHLVSHIPDVSIE
ncbi:hypothetical protein ACP70R_004114 [Stipagrostis hirtigluma subsp. patula]